VLGCPRNNPVLHRFTQQRGTCVVPTHPSAALCGASGVALRASCAVWEQASNTHKCSACLHLSHERFYFGDVKGTKCMSSIHLSSQASSLLHLHPGWPGGPISVLEVVGRHAQVCHMWSTAWWGVAGLLWAIQSPQQTERECASVPLRSFTTKPTLGGEGECPSTCVCVCVCGWVGGWVVGAL
jgi:hypothetical protein